MKYTKELHEIVNKIRNNPVETVRNGFAATKVALALLDEIERLQDERRWIPVSERLPEVGEPVLLYLPSAWNMNGHLGIDGNWYDSDNDQFRSVTHWMPLPEPPDAS